MLVEQVKLNRIMFPLQTVDPRRFIHDVAKPGNKLRHPPAMGN